MEKRNRPTYRGLCNFRFIWIIALFLVFNLTYGSEREDLIPNKFSTSVEKNKKIIFSEPTEKRITGNACGPESDWPCMESDGCLIIKKLSK